MDLPAEIAGQIPDGYEVRWKPPRAGVIGAGDGLWVISRAGWVSTVTRSALILPAIRTHIIAGQPDTVDRLTKAQAREKAVREEAARGDRLETIACRHMLDVQGVLQIIGRDRPRPRFTEGASRIGKPPMRGRTARGAIRFEADGE